MAAVLGKGLLGSEGLAARRGHRGCPRLSWFPVLQGHVCAFCSSTSLSESGWGRVTHPQLGAHAHLQPIPASVHTEARRTLPLHP